MKKNVESIIKANGVDIRTMLGINQADYISLTDIAKYKNPQFPADVIKNWMRQRSTIEFLGLWEKLNNPAFKLVEFDQFKNNAGLNSFVLPPQQWVEKTDAIGIISKSGRYGGTYAHTDIAFEFASWVSPEFKLYIIKDYQRLKRDESNRLELGWEVKREIAKTNYRIHTDAIKEYILPQLPDNYASLTYASEADLLNVALFGMTAKEWRQRHPEAKGNIRDEADIIQLVLLINMESMNAELIKQGLTAGVRLKILRDMVMSQLKSLQSSGSIQKLGRNIGKTDVQ